MEKVLFKEEQRFTQWWIWVLLVFAVFAAIIPLTNAIMEEQSLGSSNTSRLIIYGVIAVVILTAIIVVMLFIRLKTKITYDGIYVAYIPFIRKWKKIGKNEICGFEVRKYNAITEFGGWGIKGSARNKAYNISGNIGLQIYLHDGKKILFGTQKQQAIKYAMHKLLPDIKTSESKNNAVAKKKSFLGRKTKKVLIIMAIEIVVAIVVLTIVQLSK